MCLGERVTSRTANGFNTCIQLVFYKAAFVLRTKYALSAHCGDIVQSVLQMAAEHILHMQNSLSLMNVQFIMY